jgi:GDP-L-fucose synthase
MNTYEGNDIINIGFGQDLSIRHLVELIKNVVGYQGMIVWDSSKPNGTPRKLLNIDRLKSMGWEPSITLLDGIKDTIMWCEQNGIFD